ncbi:MAG: hypothetical protein EA001_14370 [Oscillatoriales cyanobacterium]|nr:MAG: hypothetical protein EA001_14370 [Oscillatoriales cyanobacterium]
MVHRPLHPSAIAPASIHTGKPYHSGWKTLLGVCESSLELRSARENRQLLNIRLWVTRPLNTIKLYSLHLKRLIHQIADAMKLLVGGRCPPYRLLRKS